MSNEHDFDPASVLQFSPTTVEQAGSKELDKPGFRPMATLIKVDPYPPSDKYPKEGSIGRIKFTWEVEGTGEILVKRVDLYAQLKTSQKMYELLVAIWGEEKMFDYNIQALEGCKCPLYIKHARNTMSKDPNEKYADYTYEAGPLEENWATADANLEKQQKAGS